MISEFENMSEFKEMNVRNKYYVNVEAFENPEYYPNYLNFNVCWNLLRIIIQLYSKESDESLSNAKQAIIIAQHDVDGRLLPYALCVELLSDEEFKIIIKRLRAYFGYLKFDI